MKQLKKLIFVLTTILLAAPPAGAAPITWGTPQPISGESDVPNPSEYERVVGAYSVAGNGLDINGVVFADDAGQNILLYTPFKRTASFSGNSEVDTAAYSDLLKAGEYGDGFIKVGYQNTLTVGKTYMVQIWSHDDRDFADRSTTLADTEGNAVTLDQNHLNARGGRGQWVVGTFTADAGEQRIWIRGSGEAHTVVNAVALYEISESAKLEAADGGTKLLNPGEIAQVSAPPPGQPGSLAGETLEEYEERMKWFTEARFGMFIHWGPVTLTDRNIGWSRNAYRSGYHLQPKDNPGLDFTTPGDLYDDLYKYWNPVQFDADEWMQTAVDAGMKYVVLVVKHHDGFCLFDSGLTDYKSTGPEAKWKRDVLGDIAEACEARDLPLFVYYSLGDWYHPDPFTENHDRYLEYMHGQLREILTNYGKIAGIWFDLGASYCAWDPVNRKMTTGRKKMVYDPAVWGTEAMLEMFHELQPGILVNNRARDFGDYDTPEQKLGMFNMERPWESCVSLGKKWVWYPRDEIKTQSEVLALLQRSAGSDGNMLLNIGPKPDGTIEDRQVKVLLDVGEWMDQFGQSIYGTRGGPYKANRDFACTRRGSTVYLHLISNQQPTVKLPPLPAGVLVAKVMGTTDAVAVEQSDAHLQFAVPVNYRGTPNLVVELTLDRPAMEIAPIATMGSDAKPESLR